jgi:hypothetical protein
LAWRRGKRKGGDGQSRFWEIAYPKRIGNIRCYPGKEIGPHVAR